MTPLKQARIDRGWSQEDLAREAGLPQPTISRAERSGSATTGVAISIARALGSSVERLFAKTIEEPSPDGDDLDAATEAVLADQAAAPGARAVLEAARREHGAPAPAAGA